MLKRRRWPSGIFAAITMLIAVSSALLLPAQYRSMAILLFEEPGVPEEYVKSTVQTFLGRQSDLGLEMDRISRSVLSREELIQVVHRIDPYPEQMELSESEKALRIKQDTYIEQIDPITREPSDDYPAYAIYYFNRDPKIAQKICDALVQLFTERNFEHRTELANEAYSFLELEASKLRDEVSDAEDRLASFKQQFGDALPGSQRMNRESLERAGTRIIEVDRQLRAAQDRLADVRFEQAGISPILADSSTTISQELAELEKELIEARHKYTDDHPDVKRLIAAVDNLKSQLSAHSRPVIQNDRSDNGAAGISAGIKADNPAYITLVNQESAIVREIEALKAQAEDTRRNIINFRSRLKDAPEVEQQYLALSRDYEIAHEKYREIRRAQASAQLAISLESSQRSQRISIIRAAGIPETPYSPNRAGILMLGIFIALAGGIAMSGALEMLDGSVRGANDLYEITQVPPLAMIPYIANSRDRRRQRFRTILIGLLLIVVVVVIAAVDKYMQ